MEKYKTKNKEIEDLNNSINQLDLTDIIGNTLSNNNRIHSSQIYVGYSQRQTTRQNTKSSLINFKTQIALKIFPLGLPRWSGGEESTCHCKGHSFNTWGSGRFPCHKATKAHVPQLLKLSCPRAGALQ